MEPEESEDPVELDGDPDLVIATRDFQRLADSRSKVGRNVKKSVVDFNTKFVILTPSLRF